MKWNVQKTLNTLISNRIRPHRHKSRYNILKSKNHTPKSKSASLTRGEWPHDTKLAVTTLNHNFNIKSKYLHLRVLTLKKQVSETQSRFNRTSLNARRGEHPRPWPEVNDPARDTSILYRSRLSIDSIFFSRIRSADRAVCRDCLPNLQQCLFFFYRSAAGGVGTKCGTNSIIR